jgi:O-antigen/teichoic acid export membrane protein
VADPVAPVASGAVEAPAGVGGTVWRVYIASGVALAGNQVFTLLIFIVLTAAQAGLVNWGTAVCALVFYILDAGIETAIVIAAKREPLPLWTMVSAVMGFRVAAAALAFAAWIAGVVAGLLGPEEALVLVLIGLSNMVRLAQSPFTAALQVRDRQAQAAFINVVPTAGRLAALGGLVVAHAVSVASILVAGVAADVAGLVVMALAASRLQAAPAGRMTPVQLAKRLIRAAPMITAGQAVIIAQSRIDWLLVAALASYAALANYALANKAVELIVLGGSIFGRAALPWFVEGWTSRDIGPTVRYLIAFSTVSGLVLALGGWPVLQLLTGEKYSGAAPMIPILAGVGPALVLFVILQFAVVGQGAARLAVIAGGAALFAQIAIDVVAIPRVGAIGATYGMCAFAAVSLPGLLLLATRDSIIGRRPAIELLLGAAVLPAGLLLVAAGAKVVSLG